MRENSKTSDQEEFTMGLEGKTAIVTGGAQGIGKAIAMRLARDGANIGILDLQQDAADKTVQEATELGVKGVALGCDVTDYAKVKTCVAAVKGCLRIHRHSDQQRRY